MLSKDLLTIVNELEEQAGAVTSANQSDPGFWRRIALASEDAANFTPSLHSDTISGYMRRTALALESITTTTGAEEGDTFEGLLERIADALEAKNGATYPGNSRNRFLQGASNVVFVALAAISDKFTIPEYKSGSTTYSPLSTFPGYTFTRTGTQGAIDAAGAVQFFAANVPAINSAGFHNHAAATNLVLHSQDLTAAAWVKGGVTVASNALAAPDGTMTADTVTIAGSGETLYQLVPVTASTTYTFFFFAKRGTAPDLFYSIYNETGGTNVVAPTSYFAQTSTDWKRIALTFTTPVGCTTVRVAMLRDTPASTGTVHFWQADTFAGSFPNGAPIIPTTTASLGIGAGTLTQTLATGNYSGLYTFDNNTTQTISTSSTGVFTFPTTTRPIVKEAIVSAV